MDYQYNRHSIFLHLIKIKKYPLLHYLKFLNKKFKYLLTNKFSNYFYIKSHHRSYGYKIKI